MGGLVHGIVEEVVRSPIAARRAVATVAAVAIVLTGCSTPVVEQTLTDDAEIQRVIDTKWDSFHERYPGITRPDVAIQKVINPDDWGDVVGQCMRDDGFPDVKVENGQVGWTSETGQESALQLAFFVCEARFPIDPKYTRDLTDAQWGLLFDYYVTTLVPCLSTFGYEIPDPPSRTAFIENHGAGDAAWAPYMFVDAGAENWDELNATCPQSDSSILD
jgi:hypothetical protein